MSKTKLIRTIYVYLFSLVGLILIIVASVRFIDMGLKTWVFTEADKSDYRYEIEPKRIAEDGTVVEAEEVTEEEKEARQNKRITQQRQRDAANSLAMLIVGLPLYLYHWRLAGKRRKEDE
jgi:sensor histidine kinase regulating citrate/malate metabolism